MRAPKSVDVKLDLKLFPIGGTWEPNDTERRAAWELYVELVTRISVVPLRDGIAREALTSLYAIFGHAATSCAATDPTSPNPNATANTTSAT